MEANIYRQTIEYCENGVVKRGEELLFDMDSQKIVGLIRDGIQYTLVRADEPLLARVKQLESFLVE